MANETMYNGKPWLKSYGRGVPEHVEYEKASLNEFLARSAANFPERDALIFQGYRVSFKELKDMVDRFARCLSVFGIKKGDAVSILLPNVIPCVVAYFAILKCGAVAVMNNPLYSDVELERQFNDSGSRVLITLDRLAERMIKLRPKTGIREIVYTSIGDYLPFHKKILFSMMAKRKGDAAFVREAGDVFRWKDVISRSAPDPPEVAIGLNDVAMYQYTGGTTGVSKGVMLTHANLSTQVQAMEAWFPRFGKGEEIILGALPFFHVFGLTTVMNLAVYLAWTNILIHRPRPEALLAAIEKFKPTFAPLVPTMYIGMMNHPDIRKRDMTSLKGCFSGSAPLPVEVIHDFEKITGSTILEGFGMTETSPVTHINPFTGGATKVGSVGIPISDTECRIVDTEDGRVDMPPGERGELIIRGPQVMKGYKGMPEETATTLKEGWIYTGDVATMDEDGYFYIIDRVKDMIISRGNNVYPRDIDQVFYTNPKVKEVCTIGVPDPERGEIVKVFLVLKEGKQATEKEMISFCKDKLARYKWPAEIEFRETLPKTNAGKILRMDLRLEEMEKRQ
ncbi:MAG: long-chain fatty acid--CoA ligase [Deltaproteobacteria bacterium]|nr:long-chain fatty acid--CoA ligase [Deltaproteobacteria bacterium]